MKTLLVLLTAFLSIGISNANAEYVCGLGLAQPVKDPTLGTNGYIALLTATDHSCNPTSFNYICSKNATNKVCGIHSQYSEASLLSVYEALRSSEASKQGIWLAWDQCIGGGQGNCMDGVTLFSD